MASLVGINCTTSRHATFDVCQVTLWGCAYDGRMSQSYIATNAQVGDAFDLPEPIRDLAEKLRLRALETSQAAKEELEAGQRDELFLLASFGFANESEREAKDLRTLLTAYAHAVARERPSLQEVASWQRVTPGNLRRRYSPIHVDAVTSILSERVSFDLVETAFASVDDEMLHDRNDQARHDYRMRTDIRSAFAAFIDETADVLHGEGWRGRTLVESRFDPNPLRGYSGVSALSVESKRALTDVSPNLVEHALSRLTDAHARYFEFERHAVEQAGVVPRA